MKHLMKCICLSLVFVLPLSTYAKLTGEIIFIHPDNPNELWITDITDTANARLLFQQTHPIRDFSVQKNGNYIATLTEYSDPKKPHDIYLIDTDNISNPERMMTHQRFHQIIDVYLSQNPDLIYTNFLPAITDNQNKSDRFGRRTSGIYLIIKQEIEETLVLPEIPPLLGIISPPEVLSPRVSLVKGVVTEHVALSPDGKYLAYDTPEGVYYSNLETGQDLRVSIGGNMPAFSPDGTKLAVVFGNFGNLGFFGSWYDLYIFSVPSLRHIKTIERVTAPIEFLDIKWSPDGKYIVYTTYSAPFWEKNNTYQHYAIPYEGGEQIRLLDNMFENRVSKFDWTHIEETFPVEPKNRLTTLWGTLKQ